MAPTKTRKHGGSPSSSSRRKKKMPRSQGARCCTWPLIVVILVGLAAIGVLIWQFAPIDDVIDKILPIFNKTSAPTSLPSFAPSLPPGKTLAPTFAPTMAPSVFEFRFNQCASTENCCNGLDTICDLRVNEIMFATPHNSHVAKESGFDVFPNHERPLEEALEAGYRGLNMDVCSCGGNLVFCHSFCPLGTRSITEVYNNLVSFLKDNPTEVVILPTQLDDSADQLVSLDALYGIMQSVPDFVNMIYVHPEDIFAPWPTLRTLVETNKRILFFHYNGPECENNSCPPGFHHWFTYAMETEFSFNNVEAIEDTANSCRVTRGGSGTGAFFGVNNFVTLPTRNNAETVNRADFIDAHIDACSQLNGDASVNLVFVDFWSVGDLPQVVQRRNAALARRRRQTKLRH